MKLGENKRHLLQLFYKPAKYKIFVQTNNPVFERLKFAILKWM